MLTMLREVNLHNRMHLPNKQKECNPDSVLPSACVQMEALNHMADSVGMVTAVVFQTQNLAIHSIDAVVCTTPAQTNMGCQTVAAQSRLLNV